MDKFKYELSDIIIFIQNNIVYAMDSIKDELYVDLCRYSLESAYNATKMALDKLYGNEEN